MEHDLDVRSHLHERVRGERCVLCNGEVVAAWFCDACAITSERYAARFNDDTPSPTASKIAKHAQLRREQAAAYEQWSAIVSVIDRDVIPAENGRVVHRTSERDGSQSRIDSPLRASNRTRRMMR